MSALLLHGNGWDEFLLIGGAVLIAFLVVKFTTRGADDEPGEPAEALPPTDEARG